MILKDRPQFPISDPLKLNLQIVPFKRYCTLTFKLGFPYCVEKFDGFGGHIEPPKSIFLASAYQKGTSLGQDASFEPSTINHQHWSMLSTCGSAQEKKEDGLWFKQVQQHDITRMC